MYNILLPIKISYLELNSDKQNEIMRGLAQKIFDYQGKYSFREKGLGITGANGKRIKYQPLTFYFGYDKNNTFKISLDNDEVKVWGQENGDKINNIIFANISNEEFVILSSGTLLREGEYVKRVVWGAEWADIRSDSYYESNGANKSNGANREVFIDSQTKEFLKWQVKSGEWNKQGK